MWSVPVRDASAASSWASKQYGLGQELIQLGGGVLPLGKILHVIQRREVMGRPRQDNTVLGRGRHIPFQSHLTPRGSYKLPVSNRPFSISLNALITDISSYPSSSLLTVITIAHQISMLNFSRSQKREERGSAALRLGGSYSVAHYRRNFSAGIRLGASQLAIPSEPCTPDSVGSRSEFGRPLPARANSPNRDDGLIAC